MAKGNALDILPLLFEKIIIPKYVFEREIKAKAGSYLSAIKNYIGNDKLFRVEDRETDRVINQLAKPIIEDKRVMVGRGMPLLWGFRLLFQIMKMNLDILKNMLCLPIIISSLFLYIGSNLIRRWGKVNMTM